jgi:hypothetical protein
MIFIETLLLDGFLATIRTYSRVFDGLGSFEKKRCFLSVFMKPTQYGTLPVPDQNALVEHRVRELGEAPNKLSSVFWF